MAKQVLDPELVKLEGMYEKAARARKPHDIEWVLDAAFYCGKHYTEWYDKDQCFREIPRGSSRAEQRAPRPVANKVYHFVMDTYAASKLSEPSVEVLSSTMDAMDVSNAKVAQAWLGDVCSPTKANWPSRMDEGLFWVALCGETWHKWTFDKVSKQVKIEMCPPLEVYLDPTPNNYLDARWIIHARGMDPEDVYDRYGVDLPPSALERQDTSKQTVLREIGMVTGTQVVMVKELWELPSRRHPEGRFAVWAAGKWLVPIQRFPYSHLQLPFTQIGHSRVPGTAHYTSGTRSMRPLNMELNQYHGQKINSRKKNTNIKWFIDTQLAESLNELPDDSVDQILKGDSRNGLMTPQILQATPWPDNNDGEWLVEEMRDAVGLHEASTGSAPGRVDSAQGIEQLQEADRGRLTDVESTLKVAVGRGFAQLIQLGKQYVPDEQIVADYSNNAAPAVHRFKTETFPSKPLMKVVIGAGMPKNRAARRAEILAMWSAGLLGDNPRKALAALDYPADMNLTGEEIDVLEAENENMLMLRGIAVTPKPWQNHELHRRVHDEARKSAEFVSASQDVWDTFEFHLDATEKAELVEIQDEAERQAHIQAVAEAAAPPVPAGPEAPAPAAPTTGQPKGQAPTTGATA